MKSLLFSKFKVYRRKEGVSSFLDDPDEFDAHHCNASCRPIQPKNKRDRHGCKLIHFRISYAHVVGQFKPIADAFVINVESKLLL